MRGQPSPPSDLAGRWLAKFFTDHLAGERAASPRTVASYRDAMKLLLTWFSDTEHIPPEKLRLADIDRARVLRFLDWLEAERNCTATTRNQRLAVIKSFCRYTAVEQPDRLDQLTQVLAIRQKNAPTPELGHLTGDEVKTLLAEPGTANARALRDTVLLALAYDTGARVQELSDLNVADIRRATPMTVTIHGKGSKTRYVPIMGPTARLLTDYLNHLDPHPGLSRSRDSAAPRPGSANSGTTPVSANSPSRSKHSAARNSDSPVGSSAASHTAPACRTNPHASPSPESSMPSAFQTLSTSRSDDTTPRRTRPPQEPQPSMPGVFTRLEMHAYSNSRQENRADVSAESPTPHFWRARKETP